MNIETQKRFLIRIGFWAVVILLMLVGFQYVLPVVLPFVMAFLIAALLDRPIRFLAKRLNGKRVLPAIGLTLLFYLLAACSVPVAALFPGVFRQVPVSRLMQAALGLLFCVIGNFMPKFRHNYFCGIKSPWALANEENWRRTHRFAGPLWFWGGLGVAVLSFVLPQAAMFAASFAVFLALAVVPFVYSYILYKKAHANTRGS